MESSEDKFDRSGCGKICDASVTPQKGPAGKDIGVEDRVKDLRVIINEKVEFGDHTDEITISSNEWSDNETSHHERWKTDDENVQRIDRK